MTTKQSKTPRLSLSYDDTIIVRTKINEALEKLETKEAVNDVQVSSFESQGFTFSLAKRIIYALQPYLDKQLVCANQYSFSIIQPTEKEQKVLSDVCVHFTTWNKTRLMERIDGFLLDPVLYSFITDESLDMEDVSSTVKEVAQYYPLFTYLESQDVLFKACFDKEASIFSIKAPMFEAIIPIGSDADDNKELCNKYVEDLATKEKHYIVGIDLPSTLVEFIIKINKVCNIS